MTEILAFCDFWNDGKHDSKYCTNCGKTYAAHVDGLDDKSPIEGMSIRDIRLLEIANELGELLKNGSNVITEKMDKLINPPHGPPGLTDAGKIMLNEIREKLG